MENLHEVAVTCLCPDVHYCSHRKSGKGTIDLKLHSHPEDSDETVCLVLITEAAKRHLH